MKMKKWVLITIVIIFSFTFTSCQPSTAEFTEEPTAVTDQPTSTPKLKPWVRGFEATPLYGGTLMIPQAPELDTCNAAITTRPTHLPSIFDGLALYDSNLELHPELADSWDISEDGLTIKFNLRKGVKWHDGESFTSADVKFTWENALMVYHPRGKVANETIDSIEIPDNYTVIFHMAQPSPGFLFQIGMGESLIIPKHIYEKEDIIEGPHASCQELPIGTGPFKATEHILGSHFTMVRNEDWWGTEGTYWTKGAPFLDKITIVTMPDEIARVNGLESGELGLVPYTLLPAHEVARFQAMDGRDVIFECSGVPVMSLYQFNLRRTDAPYADIRVRQAIAWALDFDEINEKVYYGNGIPNSTFLPPDHPDYNPNLKSYQPRDLAKAEALLDEAGYPRGGDGVRFEISVSAYTWPERTDMANIFKQQVEETGIKVNLDIADRAVIVDKVFMQHDFDISVDQLGVYDPSTGVARLFRSDNIGETLFNNAAAYVNPEMDELWYTYSTNLDPELRRKSMYRIQEIILEDLPVIYVNTPTNWQSFNTQVYDGWSRDCIGMLKMLFTVWWKEGRLEP